MSGPAEFEQRFAPSGSGEWAEQHRLLVAVARDADPPLVVATQVGHHGPAGRTSFLAYVGDGPQPLVISELEATMPDRGWELRSSGLWADHICEAPFEHWSYGLEAFALAIDDPSELLGRGFGERVPLGWELEFEATDPADPVPGSAGVEPRPMVATETAEAVLAARSSDAPSGWYRQLGVVHGLLLDAAGETEIEGRAVRSHRWGTQRFGADGLLADGAAGGEDPVADVGFGLDVALPGIDEVWWITRTPGGVRTLTDYESSR